MYLSKCLSISCKDNTINNKFYEINDTILYNFTKLYREF